MTPPRVLVFDLDDTLYPERDYVRSGLAAIDAHLRASHGRAGFFEAAWVMFCAGLRGRIIDLALAEISLAATAALVGELIGVYRDHRPTIALYPDVARVIPLVRPRVRTAIVSDGPLVSQQRKVEALGLEALFAPIVLTDAWGRDFWKPHEGAFRAIEAVTGASGPACLYAGDNPAKDFAGPRRLGWRTVRVRRPGGEHAAVAADGAADVECANLEELVQLLGLASAEEVSA
jgi:putative hydrolase of the HAD superfamily